MLSHANSVQAYRAAIDSFSNVPHGNPWKIALDVYWVLVLVGGTLITLVITAKFFYNLPRWTNIDVDGEQEPPAPYETTMSIQNVIATGRSREQTCVRIVLNTCFGVDSLSLLIFFIGRENL